MKETDDYPRCLHGHTEVVKLFIDFGMDINLVSLKGKTPLYEACEDGHYDAVKFLLG